MFGVTPEDLAVNNGKLIVIIDFTGQIYEGILHYDPSNEQFPIQIWSDDCCFITYLQIDDVEEFFDEPPSPCLIKAPCCTQCLPSTMLMDISGTNPFCTCLVNEAYILEWNVPRQRYQFDYPGICECGTFSVYLACVDRKWVVYLALKNAMELTCVDGINLDFPLDCATMMGSGMVQFSQTGTCACGPCANDTFTVTFRPLL